MSEVVQNPYTERAMITDPAMFFGRRAELETIFRRLAGPQCVAVVGGQRIGKSSLLFYLAQPAIYGGRAYLPDPDRTVIAYLDLLELGDLTKGEFLAEVLTVLAEASGRPTDPDFDATEDGFRRWVRATCRAGLRLVLCLDEFEHLARCQHLDADFFAYLRGLANRYDLAYVTASHQDLCAIDPKIEDSEFWSIFTPLRLGLMPPGEAQALVEEPHRRAGLPLTPGNVQFALDAAGRHPLYLQMASYYLFEARRRKDEVGPLDYPVILDEFRGEASLHYDYAWRHLRDEERETLKMVAGAADGPLPSEAALRSLIQKALVVTERARPVPFAGAFRSFVREVVAAAEPGATQPPPRKADGRVFLTLHIAESRNLLLELAAGQGTRFTDQCVGTVAWDERTVRDYGRRVSRLVGDPHWYEDLKRIGRDLYADLVASNPKIIAAFGTGQGQVAHDEDLVLVFRTARELLGLPFEFLCPVDSADEYQDPLMLNYPIRRAITGVRTRKWPLSGKFHRDETLRCLLMASDAHGDVRLGRRQLYLPPLPAVRDGDELERIERLFQERKTRCHVDVVRAAELTYPQVRELLTEGGYHLVHYAGHGYYDPDDPANSALFFWQDERRQAVRPLRASELKNRVKDTPVRFVYLSCCQGAQAGAATDLLASDFLGVMDALLVAQAPAVLGMRWPVSDDVAPILAEAFYQALMRGDDLDLALLRARRAAADHDETDPSWAAPILVVQ